MNVKERIICARIGRLDPETDAEEIGALKAQLVPPVPPPAPTETNAPELPAPPAGKRTVPTVADVEDFRALDAEVHIRSPRWGDIWLVPKRTGSPRFELLPEEVRILDQARKLFDARVVEVSKNVPARL